MKPLDEYQYFRHLITINNEFFRKEKDYNIRLYSAEHLKSLENLVEGIKEGKKEQVLLGDTGTGKTFMIANVIKEVNKPTLVLAHNKTLAGQLYSEFK